MNIKKGGKEKQEVREMGPGGRRVTVPVSSPVALFLFSV